MTGRAWSLVWRAVVCLATFLVVLLVGVGFHEHFSWAQAAADASEVLQTIRRGEIVSAAVASPWVTLLYLTLCVIAGELVGRRLDRKRSKAPRDPTPSEPHSAF